MGYAAWATMDNAREMRASIDDLIAVSDDDPNTVAVLTDANGNYFSEDQLEERAYFYRRNRDLSILGFSRGARTAGARRQHRCDVAQPRHV